MSTLSRKDQRKLLLVTERLFNKKSFFYPKSIKDISTNNFFQRELRLTGSRSLFLTDYGYDHFRTVADLLERADVFDGMAEFSDIWNAWHKVVGTWLSNNVKPESADQIVQAISDLVWEEVDDHVFVVPVFGVELDAINSFSLGTMMILRLSAEVLDAADVEHDHTDIPHLLELNKNYLWLKGVVRGTERVAKQRFSERATLTAGVLAISAASMYEFGATAFRIGIVMTPEDATGRSVWFSWREAERSLTTHYAFPRTQMFPINSAISTESDLTRMIHRAINIVQTGERTELEEAIARAVYWYSDAHRDSVQVMKLVKYWSCVEAFFSLENEEITHAVSAGLTSILVFGGFQFVSPTEYSSVKKQIVRLYGLRSRAVHRGFHEHATERDVAQFSQWVAWMIITMVALTERGYTTLKEVKTQTERLDRLEKQKRLTA